MLMWIWELTTSAKWALLDAENLKLTMPGSLAENTSKKYNIRGGLIKINSCAIALLLQFISISVNE